MACTDLMEQLSLLDPDQPRVCGAEGDNSNQLPFKQSIVAAKLDGVHTDVVISEFRNRVLIVITQCQKVASFISVIKDAAEKACGDSGREVYVVRTLFGTQVEESDELAARYLSEHSNLSKPAIFALGLRDHSPRTIRALETLLKTHKSW